MSNTTVLDAIMNGYDKETMSMRDQIIDLITERGKITSRLSEIRNSLMMFGGNTDTEKLKWILCELEKLERAG